MQRIGRTKTLQKRWAIRELISPGLRRRPSPLPFRRPRVESLEARLPLAAELAVVEAPSVIQWQGRDVEAMQGEWIVRVAQHGAAAPDELHLTAYEKSVLAVQPATSLTDIPVGRRISSSGHYLFQFQDDLSTDAAMEVFSSTPGFLYAEPNFVVSVDVFPNDPDFSSLGGLHNSSDRDIDAPEAWDLTTGSDSVVVGVIDTGVDVMHEDLADNIWTNPVECPAGLGTCIEDGVDNDGNGYIDDFYGWDFRNEDNDPFDDHSHGTHVAGTIAATGNNGTGVVGVSWNAQIMALKFLPASGSGSTADAVEAIEYATLMKRDHGVNIQLTNNSWGGEGFSQSLKDAIDASRLQDMLFVAAAGNDSRDNDVTPHYPSSFDLDNIVSVASNNWTDDGLSSFSNSGLTSVDLGAPGSSIYSTIPLNEYGYKSGTSMASPQVAGVAALAWAASPNATYAQVRDAILNSVDPLSSLDGITVTGGRLNALGTLQQLGLFAVPVTPGDGEVVATAPTSFTLDFSHAIDSSTVDAGDFSVNATQADGVNVVDTDTVEFTFLSSPVSIEGPQTMTLAADSIARLSDADGVAELVSTFHYDPTPLRVTTVTPANGSVLTIPNPTVRLDFSESVASGSIDIGDLTLNAGRVDAVTVVDADTAEYRLTGLNIEAPLTITLPTGAVVDSFGIPNQPFAASFTLDFDTAPYPLELTALQTLGSLMYESTLPGSLHSSADSDTYTLDLEAGQTLSAVLEPGAGLGGRLRVLDASDTELASVTGAVGQSVVLQTLSIPTAGIYKIVVESNGATSGTYDLNLYLNVVLENEHHGGSANNTRATAQDTNAGWTNLGSSASRVGVLGALSSATDDDWYEISLPGSEVTTFAVEGLSSANVNFTLHANDGTQLASGTVAGDAAYLHDYVPPADGTYFVQISGDDAPYTLTATREISFDGNTNDTLATAQQIDQHLQVIGHAGLGDETSTGSEVQTQATEATTSSSPDPSQYTELAPGITLPNELLEGTIVREHDGTTKVIFSESLDPRMLMASSTVTNHFVSIDSDPEGDLTRDVLFTPDGSKFLVAYRDSENVLIYDKTTHAILADIPVAGEPVNLAVTQDGKYALSANTTGNSVTVIDLATLTKVKDIPVSSDWPYRVKATQDNQHAVVATADDKFVVISLTTLEEVRTIDSPGLGMTFFSFNTGKAGAVVLGYHDFDITPDSSTLVTQARDDDDRLIRIYDIATGSQSASLPVTATLRSITISEDGTKAYLGTSFGSGTLVEVDLTTNTIARTLTTENLTAETIILTPDQQFMIAAGHNKHVFIDLADGSTDASVGLGSTDEFALSHDSKYLFSRWVIDVATRTIVKNLPLFSFLDLIATSPTEYLGIQATTTGGQNLSVVNIDGADATVLADLPGGAAPEGDAPTHIAISADGLTAVTANWESNNVSIIDLENRGVLAWIDVGTRPERVAITPDGTHALVTSPTDQSLSIIDIATQSVVATLTGVTDDPRHIVISSDSTQAFISTTGVSAGDDRLHFVTLNGAASSLNGFLDIGNMAAEIAQETEMSLSPDGSLLAVPLTRDNQIALLDTATRTEIVRLPTGSFPMEAEFSPSGDRLYTLDERSNSVTVIDVDGANSSVIGNVLGLAGPTSFALDEQGEYLYVASNYPQRVEVIDTTTLEVVGALGVGSDARPWKVHLDGNVLYVIGSEGIPVGLPLMDDGGHLTRIVADGPDTRFVDDLQLSGRVRVVDFSSALRSAITVAYNNDGIDIIPYNPESTGDQDYYHFAPQLGDELVISTSRPGEASGRFENDLDIAIELYDSNGDFIARGTEGTISHTVTSLGAHTIRVYAQGFTEGEYLLSVAGVTQGSGPSLLALSPEDGASEVSLNSNLSMTFGEAIAKGTGNIVVRRSADDSLFTSIDVTSASATVATNIATIDPGIPLEVDTDYYVLVDAGAFENLDGEDFVGIADKTAWDFSTRAVNDFGDAPAPYPVLLAAGGAYHTAVGPTIGSERDVEFDGVHSSDASADDAAGTPDDEDGVTFISVRVGQAGATATVAVQGATAGARLDAWIDFDHDGNWGGPLEQIADSVAVVNGNNMITFDVPSWTIDGDTYSRFRISTAGDLGIGGDAADGEVEDHEVTILSPVSSSHFFGGQNEISSNVGSASSIFPVDLDQDGDMDLVSDSGNGALEYLVWFENDGSGAFTEREISTKRFATTVFADDIDGDGDYDIISSHVFDGVLWHENLGGGSFSTVTIDNDAGANHGTGMVAIDMEGDGDRDIAFLDREHQHIVWYENDGDQNFTKHVTVTNTGVVRLAVIDMDQDGDHDFVINKDGISWYENVAGVFTQRNVTSDQSYKVSTADVDGDGDIDVLSAASNKVAWYENDGNQSFTARFVSVANQAKAIFGADLDGDGDLDIASAPVSAFEEIAWHENDGNQNFTRHILTTNSRHTEDIAASDVDGDGDLDVVSSRSGQIHWYENLNGVPPTVLTLSPLDNATDIELDTNLVMTFDKDVLAGTGEISVFKTADDTLFETIDVTSTAVTITGSQVSIDPSSLLERDTEYYVLIGPNALVDVSGNKFFGIEDSTDWNFLTLNHPDVTLAVDKASIDENGGSAVVTATLSAAYTVPVTVDIGFSGSATVVDDYAVSGAQIVITAGSITGSVTITAVADAVIESNETVIVDITNVTNGVELGTQQTTTTIVDDDFLTPLIDSTASDPSNLAVIPISVDFGAAVTGFAEADLQVVGGAVSNLVDAGSGTFSFDLTPSADGVITIDINAASATDNGGKDTLAATRFTIASDRTAPVAVITGPAGPINFDPFAVTIDFGEAVNDFALADVTVDGGTITDLVNDGGGKFTATIDATSDGSVTVDVAASVATDNAGNDNAAATQFSVVVDTTAPAPVINGPIGATNNRSFAVTIDFGEAVAGFELSDIPVAGGAATSIVGDANGRFAVAIEATADGVVTVDVAANVAIDTAGNNNVAATQYVVLVDTVDPTPLISGPASPTNSDPFAVSIDFGEAVTGFALTDVTVTGGSATNLVDDGNGRFTATIDATADGAVTVDVAANAAVDPAGNSSTAATQFAVVVDTTPPAPVITGPVSPTNLDPFAVSIDFGETVSDFILADITVAGGNATNLVDDGNGRFTATIDATADGVVTVDVAANVAADTAENNSSAAPQFTIEVDTTAPSPTIAGPASPTNSDPFSVSIDFGEAVAGFASDEITVGGGAVTNLVDDGNGKFTATIDATADGAVTVDVAADVAADTAGNPNAAASSFAVLVDTTAPIPVITGPASPTNSDPLAVAIDFGEAVIGFTASDVAVAGGVVIGLVDNGSGHYTATIDATADGSVTVDVSANVSVDAAGNNNTVATQYSVVVDTTAPIPVIAGPVRPTNSDPFAVTIDFGEAVSGLASSDITVVGGLVTGLVDNGGGNFTATVDAAADGVLTVDVVANVAVDAAGNNNAAATQLAIVVDTTAPAPVITGPITPTNSDPFAVAIDFGEMVTGFAAADITVGGGAVIGLIDNGGGNFTATIDPAADGAVTVDVAANAAADSAGNDNTAATRYSVLVDTTVPIPVITGPASPSNSDPFDVAIEFGEAVIGLIASDIAVAGGALIGLTDDGAGNYTATIDPSADGTVTVDVAANVAVDTAGNNNAAATRFTLTVDTIAPTPVVTGPLSPTDSDPFAVAIDFGESVTGFVSSDITVGGGAVIGLIDNGGGNFTATIDAAADGNVTLDIAADVAVDTAGNNNAAATQFSVVVDTTAPSPAITGPSSPTNTDPFTLTIDFGESVTGFVSTDIAVAGGTVIEFSDDGNGAYTVTVDATADGIVTVGVAAGAAVDAAGNTSDAATPFAVLVDTTAPVPVITGPASPTNSDPFAVLIDFGEAVGGFSASDITVAGGTVIGLLDNGNGNYTATIDPAADGAVTVGVAASVAADPAGNDSAAATQFLVIVDTIAPIPVITGPDSPTNSDPFVVSIDLAETVTGFASSDIDVSGGAVIGLSDDGGGSYTATIDASGDGVVTVGVVANVAVDAAANNNTAATPITVIVDTSAPEPVITGPVSPTNSDPFAVAIDFGETVFGFTSSDIAIGGGAVIGLVHNGSGNFTATIDPAVDGTVTVDVAADVAADTAGNTNAAADQFAVVVDTLSPSPAITGPASPTTSDPFTVTIDFGEQVSGFVIDDIAVGNGSATSLVDNGNGNYTATIDAAADGAVTVDVPASVANDSAGNSNATAVGRSIVVDTTDPVITAPNEVTVEADTLGGASDANAAIVAFLAAVTAADNIDTSPTLSSDAPAFYPIGETVVTFTSSDEAGNTATTTTTVTVADTTAPTVTPPDDISVEGDATSGASDANAAIAAFLAAATATDVVDDSLTITHNAPALFTVGDTVVTFSTTDDAGNVGTATATVTVADTTDPAVTAADDITIEGDATGGASDANSQIVAFLAAVTAADIVDDSLTITHNAPALFPVGDTVVTFSTTDDAGNVGTATATVTVTDTTDPAVTAADDITIEGDATGGASDANSQIVAFLAAVTAADIVDDSLTITHNAPALFPVGDTVVTFSTTDDAGNVGTATATVTVTDTTAPVVTASGDITVEGDATGGASDANADIVDFLAAVTATDIVDDSLIITHNGPALFTVGDTLVTFSTTDDAGNVGTATATVTVADTTAPAVTASGDISVEGDATGGASDANTQIVDFLTAATAADIVDNSLTITHNAPALFPVGDTLITFSATDDEGNVGTDSATVTVTDTITPVVTAPDDITVEGDATGGASDANAEIASFLAAVTATDIVDDSLTITHNAPPLFPVGDTLVSFSTTDDSGNVAAATATVTVTDTTAPVVTASGDISVEGDATGGASDANAEIVSFLAAATAADIVDDSLTITHNAPALFPVGDTVVTFSTTDDAGNIGTATATVTVADTTDPAVNAPDDISVEGDATGGVSDANAQIVAFLASVTAADIVDDSLTITHNAPALFPVGDTIVTFSTSDDAGNVGTATATVTVADTTAPLVTASGDISVEGDATGGASDSNAQIVAFLAATTAADVVDDSLTITHNAPALFPVGDTVVTFGTTDDAGNAGTATATVTVADTTDPAVTAPDDITVEGDVTGGASSTGAGISTFLAAATTNDTVDANPTITTDAPAVLPFGDTVVTFTSTDASGNASTASAIVTVVSAEPPAMTFRAPSGAADPDDLPQGSQPTSWSTQRNDLGEIVLHFVAPISLPTAADLVLTNLGVNAPIDADTVIALRDDQLSLSADKMRLRIRPDANQLSDGVYQVDLLSGITGLDRHTISGNASNKFYVLTGDWNGSGGVNIQDFATFAYWFGKPVSPAPEYVDVNGSGGINIQDFAGFAANFGKSITFAGGTAGLNASASGEAELASAMRTLLNPSDVNGDGSVTPRDALQVINRVAAERSGKDWESSRLDANRDGHVTSADALHIINRLADPPAQTQIAVDMALSELIRGDDDRDDDLESLSLDDAIALLSQRPV